MDVIGLTDAGLWCIVVVSVWKRKIWEKKLCDSRFFIDFISGFNRIFSTIQKLTVMLMVPWSTCWSTPKPMRFASFSDFMSGSLAHFLGFNGSNARCKGEGSWVAATWIRIYSEWYVALYFLAAWLWYILICNRKKSDQAVSRHVCWSISQGLIVAYFSVYHKFRKKKKKNISCFQPQTPLTKVYSRRKYDWVTKVQVKVITDKQAKLWESLIGKFHRLSVYKWYMTEEWKDCPFSSNDQLLKFYWKGILNQKTIQRQLSTVPTIFSLVWNITPKTIKVTKFDLFTKKKVSSSFTFWFK